MHFWTLFIILMLTGLPGLAVWAWFGTFPWLPPRD